MKKYILALVFILSSPLAFAGNIHVGYTDTDNPFNGATFVINYIKGRMGPADIAFVRLLHNYGNRYEYWRVNRQGATDNFEAYEISEQRFEWAIIQEHLQDELDQIMALKMYVWAAQDQRGYTVIGTGNTSVQVQAWECSSCIVTITDLDPDVGNVEMP